MQTRPSPHLQSSLFKKSLHNLKLSLISLQPNRSYLREEKQIKSLFFSLPTESHYSHLRSSKATLKSLIDIKSLTARKLTAEVVTISPFNHMAQKKYSSR